MSDLASQVPPPVQLPAVEWVEILNVAQYGLEVDGAAAVFSWREEDEDPFDIGDIVIDNGICARAGRLPLDARMTNQRAAQLFTALPEGQRHAYLNCTAP